MHKGEIESAITADQHFDSNKAEVCKEVGRFESNDLEIDQCYALGKVEQGTEQLQDVQKEIDKLNAR